MRPLDPRAEETRRCSSSKRSPRSACSLGQPPGRQHVNGAGPEESQHEGDRCRHPNRIPKSSPITPYAAPHDRSGRQDRDANNGDKLANLSNPHGEVEQAAEQLRHSRLRPSYLRYSPGVTARRAARRAKPRRRRAHAPEQPPASKTTGTATTSQASPRNTITAAIRPIEVILSRSSSLSIASPVDR